MTRAAVRSAVASFRYFTNAVMPKLKTPSNATVRTSGTNAARMVFDTNTAGRTTIPTTNQSAATAAATGQRPATTNSINDGSLRFPGIASV